LDLDERFSRFSQRSDGPCALSAIKWDPVKVTMPKNGSEEEEEMADGKVRLMLLFELFVFVLLQIETRIGDVGSLTSLNS
jgi:hypothetical protein